MIRVVLPKNNMGYVLSAYVVDHESIANAIGSGDDALVSAVVRSNPDEFDDEDDFPPGTRRPTLRAALQQLVEGESGVSDDPQYRYAFVRIGDQLARRSGYAMLLDVQPIGPVWIRLTVELNFRGACCARA